MILAAFFVVFGLVMLQLNIKAGSTFAKRLSYFAMWGSFAVSVYLAVKSGGQLNVRL